jgi:hypothetical protein
MAGNFEVGRVASVSCDGFPPCWKSSHEARARRKGRMFGARSQGRESGSGSEGDLGR